MGGGERDDLLRGLPDRYPRIADGVARICPSRKAAGRPKGPLTQRLVPGQPARQRVALQIMLRRSAEDLVHRLRRAHGGRQ